MKHPQSTRIRFSRRPLALAGAACLAIALGGCSAPMADLPGIGLPANTPARPATPGDFPAVHDIPGPRPEAVLTPEQQEKIEKDLIAARNRQATGVQKAVRDQN